MIGSRARINNKIYHSLNYRRKNNCDSYTISYNDECTNEIKFGMIELFIQLRDDFFAIIKEIIIVDKNLIENEILQKITAENNLFDRFFNRVNLTEKIDLIRCSQIKDNCVVTETHKETFITTINLNFAHD